MISVIIIDDHQSIRESYQKVLEESSDYQVVASIPSTSLADIWCKRYEPDILLMDICTDSGCSGLAATVKVKACTPGVKVVLMTGFDEISFVPRAEEVGADGFVYKSASMCELISVIERVHAGEKVFPKPKEIPVKKGQPPLTYRELEILQLLCANHSNNEIAEALFISESTVKRHIAKIKEKTGTDSLLSLTIYLTAQGWINPYF